MIRRAVDDGAPPGSYLLAGSASDHGAHTGAGRILSLRMRSLTLSERGVGAPTVSLRQLLDAVVITTGPYAYRRSDGIAVVPAALLGP